MILNLENQEERTEYNANLVATFIEHCKNEHSLVIPNKAFETFFNA